MKFGAGVEDALNMLYTEKKIYKDYLPQDAIKAGNKLIEETKGLSDEALDEIINMVKDELPLEYPTVSVWWYSVLLVIKKSSVFLLEFIRYVYANRESFSLNTRFYIYCQFHDIVFNYPNLQCISILREMSIFYQGLVEEFAKSVNAPLYPIKSEERNKQLVLIITEQFINIQHGPTKTALDRCKTLMTKCGKNVLLLNTAELSSQVGYIPFYGARGASYDSQKMNEEIQHWKGVDIPYVQCEQNMPDLDTLEYLLNFIKEMAPEIVILIGETSILGNLVNKMIPVLTVGTVPSRLTCNTTKYQTLSRNLNSSDLELLKIFGHTEQNVIKGVFTSSLKPQTEFLTRDDIGINEDKFLLAVVGARLDTEVTDEFLNILDEIFKPDMSLIFIGRFDKYETLIKKYRNLSMQSVYIGFCDDILSRLELCDLYVNPLRAGGGTSCVEAMYKGVPVVTVNYGDVAVNSGDDFCVSDYREMQEKILKYHDDLEYYDKMSQKAKKRAELLLDTEGEFARILEEVRKREYGQ